MIEGRAVTFLIDSRAVDNIIGKHGYCELSSCVYLQLASKRLFAFGQTAHLPLLGQFNAKISVESHSTNAIFLVFYGTACNFVSVNTASKLHVYN